jgi:regulator of CtrA degradation
MGTMSLAEAQDESLREYSQQTFMHSALFERTFDEGMSLVEETARYLDGRGREEARGLPRETALLYAGESMRVTTRLMQAASWLLIQRAVREGEMRLEDAAGERYRLGSKEICFGGRSESVERLPNTLRDLLDRSERLYRRIARLEDQLFGALAPPKPPFQAQLKLIQQSFSEAG